MRFNAKWAFLLTIPLFVSLGMANLSSWRPRRVRVAGKPFQVAFSPDGSRIALGSQATATAPGRVDVWKVGGPSGLRQPSIGGQQTFPVKLPSSICFSQDSQMLVCIEHDEKGTAHRWKLAEGQDATDLRSSNTSSWTAQFAHSAPGSGDVTFWAGETVNQLDAGNGKVKKRLKIYNQDKYDDVPSGAMAFSPDGRTTAWSIDDVGALVLRDASGRKSRLAPLISRSNSLAFTMTALTYSPDSRFLVAGWTAEIYDAQGNSTASSRVTVWDLKTRKISAKWTETDKDINAHAFSPDGGLLAAARGDGTISLRDARTGRIQRLLKTVGASVASVAFSPDGRTLASCGSDGALYLWRVK